MKSLLVISATVGSLIGAYLPNIWGDGNGLGLSSILFGGLGGIMGIWLGWKLISYFD